jgi:hypothetical protein
MKRRLFLTVLIMAIFSLLAGNPLAAGAAALENPSPESILGSMDTCIEHPQNVPAVITKAGAFHALPLRVSFQRAAAPGGIQSKGNAFFESPLNIITKTIVFNIKNTIPLKLRN